MTLRVVNFCHSESDSVADLAEYLLDALQVVALDFDLIAFHRAASAAVVFQLGE